MREEEEEKEGMLYPYVIYAYILELRGLWRRKCGRIYGLIKAEWS
jgi:hypothetical protein